MRRGRILPREVGDDIVRGGFGDGSRLALLRLDRGLDLLRHFVGIDLGRAFVQRPQVLVDAGVDHQAFVDNFNRAHGRLRGLFHRRLGPEQRHQPLVGFRRRRTSVGQRRLDDGRPGGGNAREAEGGLARAWSGRRPIGDRHGRGCHGSLGQLAIGRRYSGDGGDCVCQQRADRPGVSARNRRAVCRPAVPDRRCGSLDPRPLEAANSRRCAQQRQRKPPRSRHRSPPPFGYRKARRTAGTRQDDCPLTRGSCKARKLRVIIFQKRCCANATRVPKRCKTCKLEVITAIGWPSGLDCPCVSRRKLLQRQTTDVVSGRSFGHATAVRSVIDP